MTKKEDESKMPGSGYAGHDISARRARLRTSLGKQSTDSYKDQLADSEGKDLMNEASVEHSITSSLSKSIESVGKSTTNEPIGGQSDIIKFLSHIDQALHACVEHLATMHVLANRQLEDLKVIAESLQGQNISSQVDNLSPLMESLTAAIEPMKAIGELVPAVDRLVSSAEISEQFKTRTEINNDKLILCLAEQLYAGHISQATFRKAYQAVFPEDDSVLLTQRLGDLLDSQELSGELFQSAFQALSENQSYAESYEVNTVSEEALNKEREEFALREDELNRLLADKDQEIDNVRQQMESRWSELAHECDALKKVLESRDEILLAKENELVKKLEELSAKDSENQQLKAQIQELKDKTKEMMTDMQKQLAKKQVDETARKSVSEANQQTEQATSAKSNKTPQSGFFDFINTGNANNPLFNNNSPSPLSGEVNYADNGDTQIAPAAMPNNPTADWQPVDIKASGRPLSVEQVSSQANAGMSGANAANSAQLASEAQANTQASASFVSAVGSYGSGVRAQVFEVIVRQALAGTQWREICAVPMQSNNISPQEVEAEVKRRQALLKK